MMCPRPITVAVLGTVPCGQCLNCRINKQRRWATRLLLESTLHPTSSFVTLTYAETGPSLVPEDLTKWLKRLRNTIGSYRYFAVGEYGDKNERPHYHAILFGVPMSYEDVVHTTWGHGRTETTELIRERAMYCAHYTVKKLTKNNAKLGDRHPEFMRSSRRPGLAADAARVIASAYHRNDLSKHLAEGAEIEKTIRIEGRLWPLDYFMQQKIREHLDIPLTRYERDGLWGRRTERYDNPTVEELARAAEQETVTTKRMRARNLNG